MIATDVVRQVLRAFFTEEAMPTVHHSAFEAGGVDGYADQAEHVGTGVAAIVRAGGGRGASRWWWRACTWCRALSTAPCGRAAWSSRRWSWSATRSSTAATSRSGAAARPPERYLRRFDEIRALQEHLSDRARVASVAVIENENVDETLLALDAARARRGRADRRGGRGLK